MCTDKAATLVSSGYTSSSGYTKVCFISKELAAVMQKRHFISSHEESNGGTDLVIEETSEVVVETTSQVDQPP